MCQSIYIPKLNDQISNKSAYKKVFGGSTPSDLEYYCVTTLVDEQPDVAIIHVATNRIGKDDPFVIAKGIMNIVKVCQDRGCNTVFYLALYTDQTIQTKCSY